MITLRWIKWFPCQMVKFNTNIGGDNLSGFTIREVVVSELYTELLHARK